MRNKFTITEGEVQRILGLHKQAFLKENVQNILNEEKTYTLQSKELFFKQKDGGFNSKLKLFKGTTFKVWPEVKDSLITTRKVTAQFVTWHNGSVLDGWKYNKAYVAYNCKTKNFYLIGSTIEVVHKSKDFANNKYMVFPSAGQTPPLDKLCLTKPEVEDVDVDDIPDEQEVEKKLDDTNPDFVDTPKKDPKVIGNKYTFDFEAVMKAIDDTGKCSKDKSNDLNPDCSSKCSEQPKLVPPGSIVAQYQGYFYDSIQGKCIEVTGQRGPFGSTDECEKCNCGGKDPVGDKVKSGLNNDVNPIGDKVKSDLNNVVNPVNTTISDELYYKIIAP